MGYYKFDPKNHICSLVWTGIVLVSQLDADNGFINKVLTTGFMGVSTVFVGINMREKEEKKIREKIVNYINQNRQATVGQLANTMNRSGQEIRNILDSLVKEERIDVTNRSSDMAVVYIPGR